MVESDANSLASRAKSGDPEAAEEYALELLSAAPPGSGSFREGMDWLERAIEAGRLSALLIKGNVHLQHASLENAGSVARQCYEDAARAGDPAAVERLADLYQFGYGVAEDPAKTFSLYRQLAGYGFPSVLCQTAYLYSEGIGCDRDEVEASNLVLRAAAQGHTLAFVLASLRYGQGSGVPVDATIAAAWMELASARGFPGAESRWQGMLEGLDENSRNRSRELADEIKQNLRTLGQQLRALSIGEDDPEYLTRFNELVEQNYAELALAELSLQPDTRGFEIRRRGPRSFSPEACSWSPRVFRIPGFASEEEIAHLLDSAQPLLVGTAEAREQARKAVEIDAFDGECAIIAQHLATPVTRNLTARFALVTQVGQKHFEPMSVLRYSVGHEYSPHVDYFDAERMERHREVGDFGGQRIMTALIHLIVAESGGETFYPASDTVVDGAPGTAVIHHNAKPDGLGDPASLHQGRPIDAGEKWLARTAIREAPLYDNELVTL
ncbi:MAG: 2OG-Fe(II) oxygenase [Xanthomonadales bacterium]|nr:2OG-Fe(II) oxygenase [Xanthomonadales bacterium]